MLTGPNNQPGLSSSAPEPTALTKHKEAQMVRQVSIQAISWNAVHNWRDDQTLPGALGSGDAGTEATDAGGALTRLQQTLPSLVNSA